MKLVKTILLVLFAFAVSSKTDAAEAGWAEVDITPPVGIALGGRGGSGAVPSTKVLDPLYAQVCYVKDEKGAGFALVSFDIVGMSHDLAEKIRADLVHELGVDWKLAILNCSHTHSGPNMIRENIAAGGPFPQNEVDYFKSLRTKITEAARSARKSVKPVDVQIFEGTSDVAINRRGTNKLGKISILPNPKGPIDENLWVLKLTPKDGSAPAVVFSYACHAVIVYGYAYTGISADFPGVARNALREHLGAGTHVQFVQGFAGNVRPRAVANAQMNGFGGGNPDKLKKAGTDLANDVMAALKGKGDTIKPDFAAATDRPFLARDNPPPRDTYEKMKTETNAYTRAAAEYWLKAYDTGEGFAKGDAWPFGLIRFDKKHWIVFSAGEPVVEWRPKIAKWLGSRKVVTFGYCESATYLPTDKLLPEGGYEVLECNRMRASSPAPFAPGLEEALRKSLLRQLAFIEAGVK